MGQQRIFSVDLDEFDERVIAASNATPVIVDFWADWCAPCHAVAPHLAKVIDDLDGQALADMLWEVTAFLQLHPEGCDEVVLVPASSDPALVDRIAEVVAAIG